LLNKLLQGSRPGETVLKSEMLVLESVGSVPKMAEIFAKMVSHYTSSNPRRVQIK